MMPYKKWLYIDFETIGTSSITSPVVNCAYVVVDPEKFLSDEPYRFYEILNQVQFIKFSIEDQVNRFGKYVEKDDLDWWRKQPKEVRNQIHPSSIDQSYEYFMARLLDYTSGKEISHWWARGSHFDGAFLEMIAQMTNMRLQLNTNLSPFKLRDVRTFIEGKFSFQLLNTAFIPIDDEEKWNAIYKAHDPSHDLAADIMRMQKIMRVEANLPSE